MQDHFNTSLNTSNLGQLPPKALTNYQRGNKPHSNRNPSRERTIFELAAQGELFSIDRDIVFQVDENNFTPLFWAAAYGQLKTVEQLLRYDANLNHRSYKQSTPLIHASAKGFLNVVKILLDKGADIDAVDEKGNSAIFYAAYNNYPLIIEELMKRGANILRANNDNEILYDIFIKKDNYEAQAMVDRYLLNYVIPSKKLRQKTTNRS